MEILGLLDTLEAMILDGTKIPLSKKIIINEEKVLAVIDKMRLVIQGGGGFAKDAIVNRAAAKDGKPDARRDTAAAASRELMEGRSQEEAKAVEVLQEAYQMAKEIREGADGYADEVLANLEATSTRILRTIKAGRDRLTKTAPAEETK
jgi:cell division septum initiation protein DivIVA